MSLDVTKIMLLSEKISNLNDSGILMLKKCILDLSHKRLSDRIRHAFLLATCEVHRRGLNKSEVSPSASELRLELVIADDGSTSVVLPDDFEEQLRKLAVPDSADDFEEYAVKILPIDKAKNEDDRHIIAGVVLEPDTTDAHGDTIKAEEIERAAHGWLARFQDRGLQHQKIINSKLELFESHVTTADLTMNGQKVKKGTWILMLHVLDKDLWKDIKSGKLTGFSMGGIARRVKL